MGLDMYAFAVDNDEVDQTKQTDVNISECKSKVEIYYWRKFNALHGWMEDLYIKKGGTEEFNCTTVRLMAEDLDELEQALQKTQAKKSGGLTPTAGFFFGSKEIYPEDLEDLAKFIKEARESLNSNKTVFYDSWW